MFSSRANPSPNRSSIKEANDHLQLLHERVMELEKTVQEQAEALIKKDEHMQTRLRELAEVKDEEIHELAKQNEIYESKIKKLESIVKEKDAQIEQLSHRCALIEDIAVFTPNVEKLLTAMKKLPSKTSAVKHVASSRPKSRSASRVHNTRVERRSVSGGESSVLHDGNVDGHVSIPGQSFVDLRIGRSFNINSNFSMSEDEGDNEIV